MENSQIGEKVVPAAAIAHEPAKSPSNRIIQIAPLEGSNASKRAQQFLNLTPDPDDL